MLGSSGDRGTYPAKVATPWVRFRGVNLTLGLGRCSVWGIKSQNWWEIGAVVVSDLQAHPSYHSAIVGFIRQAGPVCCPQRKDLCSSLFETFFNLYFLL
jgi:hypothetical protein